MKYFIIVLVSNFLVLSQDYNFDGLPETINRGVFFDINGDGLQEYSTSVDYSNTSHNFTGYDNSPILNFTQIWQSPAGAFTNCWDGYIGYIDNDTLLDIAGFTFSPAKFYIWEQAAGNPDSFYLVQEFVKAEGGSFGAIVVGDTDGDSKKEVISADVLGIARIYIYENNGDNVYVDQNTQTTLVHPSNGQGAQGLFISDLNKNGRKEIVLLRGSSGGGEVRLWEHTGSTGNPVYTNIYTYSTVTYIFGKGGLGDGDNDGWDEVYLTFGGFPIYNTFIRRIEFDSASAAFQHLIFEAPSIGFPASYRTYDLGNDGVKELIMTGNSNSVAAVYVFRRSGSNSFNKIDSIFETADNNNMLISDMKVLTGNTNPTLLLGSFNGRVYTYQYNGSSFTKDYENLSFPGAAVRRVYWLPTGSYDGFFNTWSSSSSNGAFYVFKRDNLIGINSNQMPAGFELYQNFPNPFNPATNLSFDIPVSMNVQLKIFDLLGKERVTLLDKFLYPGKYSVQWNASYLPSGVYYCQFTAGDFYDTKKMILIK